MSGPLAPRPAGQPGEESRLRISDHERHQVADLLRDAAGAGRIDFEELDERLTATYAAKTFGDLVPITSDLPVARDLGSAALAAAPQQDLPAIRHQSTMAVMGASTRRGVWEIGPSHVAFAMWAGVEIDLREARFAARETVIQANAIWAGIDIYVNPFTHVIVEGMGIMGAFDQGRDKVQAQVTADSPIVRVKGFAVMAGITVTRRAMPGDEKPRWSLRHRR